jgi:hypothetical protein
MLVADGYNNNQFLGEWVSYKNNSPKPVGWGNGRLPATRGNFDIGDGEFIPDKKYHDNGWEEYKQYYNE